MLSCKLLCLQIFYNILQINLREALTLNKLINDKLLAIYNASKSKVSYCVLTECVRSSNFNNLFS